MTPNASPIDPPVAEQLEMTQILPVPQKDTLRIDEAAALIGCTARQVRRYIEDGSLLALNISRKSPIDPTCQRQHVRIPRKAIELFLEERRTV